MADVNKSKSVWDNLAESADNLGEVNRRKDYRDWAKSEAATMEPGISGWMSMPGNLYDEAAILFSESSHPNPRAREERQRIMRLYEAKRNGGSLTKAEKEEILNLSRYGRLPGDRPLPGESPTPMLKKPVAPPQTDQPMQPEPQPTLQRSPLG